MVERQPSTRAITGELSFALVIHLMMLAVMTGSVAFALGRFLSAWLALPVAMAFSALFSHLVSECARGDLNWTRRALSFFFATFIVLVTCSLSSGSLYERLFAEQSAFRYFDALRSDLLPRLDRQIGNAETARLALEAWRTDAEAKYKREASIGGTCPNKAHSDGARGSIAMFREGEQGIAATLSQEFTQRLGAARQNTQAFKATDPTSYSSMLVAFEKANAAIDASAPLSQGAFIEGVLATLQRQLDLRIRWSAADIFFCGDTLRDETVHRAITAIKALQSGETLVRVRPAIDLRDSKEVMIVGLLRGFNLSASLPTGGALGDFSEDPLMSKALRKGAINRETLPYILAVLIEVCVVLSGRWASRQRHAVGRINIGEFHDKARQIGRQLRYPASRLAFAALVALAEFALRLVTVDAPAHDAPAVGSRLGNADPTGVLDITDPTLPPRELQWAASLIPWLVYVQRDAFVCIPNTTRTIRARDAARCLEYSGLSTWLRSAARWGDLESQPQVVNQLSRLVPDAKQQIYEIHQLSPSLAQALRLEALRAPYLAQPSQ